MFVCLTRLENPSDGPRDGHRTAGGERNRCIQAVLAASIWTQVRTQNETAVWSMYRLLIHWSRVRISPGLPSPFFAETPYTGRRAESGPIWLMAPCELRDCFGANGQHASLAAPGGPPLRWTAHLTVDGTKLADVQRRPSLGRRVGVRRIACCPPPSTSQQDLMGSEVLTCQVRRVSTVGFMSASVRCSRSWLLF